MARFTLFTDDPVLHDFASLVGSEGAVTVAGSHSRWSVGGELASGVRTISAPIGVVKHEPEEMLVTVRAGTMVADLHDELAGTGQRTSLPERGGTVGGAVAVGENCLDRVGRGSVRDAVLQVRFVNADGELVTGGGPVVKNVTGFNLPKLITGSLGTLGCIAEVILRTNPIPPKSIWLSADEADPVKVFAALLHPSAVLWDGTTTWAHLEGHEADVVAETAMLASIGDFVVCEGPPDLPAHRWRLSPSQVFRQCVLAPFVASVGVGTTWASAAQPKRPLDRGASVVAKRMKDIFDPDRRFNPGRCLWT